MILFNVEALRECRKLTTSWDELAKYMGISTRTLEGIRYRGFQPSAENLAKIQLFMRSQGLDPMTVWVSNT